MPTVFNILSDQTRLLLTSVGQWSLIGTAPHSLTFTSEQNKFTGFGSLKLTAGSTADLRVETIPFASGDNFGWPVRAFVWVKTPRTATVTAAVHVYTPARNSASASFEVPANRWTLVSATGIPSTEGGSVAMGLGIAGLSTSDVVYATRPVIINPNAISRNVFVQETWARLPQYLQEVDVTQVDPESPMLRFMDVMLVDANDVANIWNESFYIPPEDGGLIQEPSVFEPQAADLEVLRWWAQLLGITFYDPSGTSTPWINFMRGLDPDENTEWLDWMTGLDLAPTDGTITWSEIQNYAPEATGLLDLLRWEVETAYFGLRAGTKEAILECVKKVLTGTQYTNYIVNVSGDPWKFKVQTKQSETPENPTLGTASATVEAIVAHAVPAGFQFVHETVAG